MNVTLKSLIFCCSVLLSFTTYAEQKIVKGNWDIHYIAFPSSFLDVKVAQQYGLERSMYNAVINIAVLDNENKDKAQNVNLFGNAKNLLGQTKELSFKKVEEGESIYYLSQLTFNDGDVFRFAITAQLGDRAETINFKKTFVVK